MIALPLGTDKLQMRRWCRRMASRGREVGDGSALTHPPFPAQAKLLVLKGQVQYLVLAPFAPGEWPWDGAGWGPGLSSSAFHKKGSPRTSSNNELQDALAGTAWFWDVFGS